MANDNLVRVRRAGQEKSVPTSWDYERSRSEEIGDIEGVGRAGASLRSLDIPGVSRKSEAQIKELGTARIRIARPGVIESPKNKTGKKS